MSETKPEGKKKIFRAHALKLVELGVITQEKFDELDNEGLLTGRKKKDRRAAWSDTMKAAMNDVEKAAEPYQEALKAEGLVLKSFFRKMKTD